MSAPGGDTRARWAALGALASERGGLVAGELESRLASVGIARRDLERALDDLVSDSSVRRHGGVLELTGEGAVRWLALHADIEQALDPSPTTPGMESCPSIPWLTTVHTRWIDAVSLNYAVEPAALARMLPPPLEPEIHCDQAWVQVLISSLRDMRPQGLLALFGVCFHQVSYRAAVQYRSSTGALRRGGYFVRSETNHHVMRAIGNALAEFKFHQFVHADVTMVRQGDRLVVGVEPGADAPGGRLVGMFNTAPLAAPPRESVWGSVRELTPALVECYDAFGVDPVGRWVYVLTIDRDPWDPCFIQPEQLYSEYTDTGALGGGVARLDSVLHVPRPCAYRWRPLRREHY